MGIRNNIYKGHTIISKF